MIEALIGWVTLILTNRRLRAERALPIIQTMRGRRGSALEIENVGGCVALDLVIVAAGDRRTIAWGLRPGERLAVDLPAVCCVDLVFRGVSGAHRSIRRHLDLHATDHVPRHAELQRRHGISGWPNGQASATATSAASDRPPGSWIAPTSRPS